MQLHCAVFLTGIYQKTRRFWNYTVALLTVFFILLMYLICILEIHLLDLAGHWISQFSCFTATVQGSGVILHWSWHSHWVLCPHYPANHFFTFHPHLNMSQVNTITCKTVLCASLLETSYQVVEAGIVCSWFGILLQSNSCMCVPNLSAPNLGLCYKSDKYIPIMSAPNCMQKFFRLHVTCWYALGLLINLKWPHSHMWMCSEKKTPLEINFDVFRQEGNLPIFMTWWIICFIFHKMSFIL